MTLTTFTVLHRAAKPIDSKLLYYSPLPYYPERRSRSTHDYRTISPYRTTPSGKADRLNTTVLFPPYRTTPSGEADRLMTTVLSLAVHLLEHQNAPVQAPILGQADEGFVGFDAFFHESLTALLDQLFLIGLQGIQHFSIVVG